MEETAKEAELLQAQQELEQAIMRESEQEYLRSLGAL